jgi:hypothetical protein
VTAKEPELAEATAPPTRKEKREARRRARGRVTPMPASTTSAAADSATDTKAEPAPEPAAPMTAGNGSSTRAPVTEPVAPESPPTATPAASATPTSAAAPTPASGASTGDGGTVTEAEQAEEPPVPGSDHMQQRRKAVMLVVAGAVAIALVGFLIGRQIESPSDITAHTSAPAASPILATVKDQKLSATVIARGAAGYGSPKAVGLTPSPLKDGAGVVTSLPKVGDQIKEGGVLLTISGRPVFVLQGAQPMYRDLGPGMSGQDVLQLEDSLARIGYNPGPVDGLYDAQTEAAVRQLYANAGYSAITASAAQLEAAHPVPSPEPGSNAGPGTQVPSNEIYFVPTAPVRVGELPVAVGSEVVTPLMNITDSTVTVTGGMDFKEAKLVKVGAPVTFDEPGLGINTTGKLTLIADQPGTNQQDQFHTYFEASVDKVPNNMPGQSVRMTVPIKTTKTKVLTVPQSAVSLAADGQNRVEVVRGGTRFDVIVQPGLSAGGFVEVKPIKGKLKPGDRVVVGNNSPGG